MFTVSRSPSPLENPKQCFSLSGPGFAGGKLQPTHRKKRGAVMQITLRHSSPRYFLPKLTETAWAVHTKLWTTLLPQQTPQGHSIRIEGRAHGVPTPGTGAHNLYPFRKRPPHQKESWTLPPMVAFTAHLREVRPRNSTAGMLERCPGGEILTPHDRLPSTFSKLPPLPRLGLRSERGCANVQLYRSCTLDLRATRSRSERRM